MTPALEDAYRRLGYEISLTHMGKVTTDDVRSLLRAIYAKRARMAELIEQVESGLADVDPEYAALIGRPLTREAAV